MTVLSSQTNPVEQASADDYRYDFNTPASIANVVDALTSANKISEWWTSITHGEQLGNEIRVLMGSESPLVFAVDHATGHAVVTWSVSACDFCPDWVGTQPTFTAEPGADGTTRVSFRHVGLRPDLECFDQCQAGWNHFLPSLRQYLEVGIGLANEPRIAS